MRIYIGCAHRQHGVSRGGAAQWRVDFNQRLRLGAVDSNFLYDADDHVPNGTVIYYALTYRVLVGPETPCQIFIDEDDWLAFSIFIASKGAPAENGNAHGAEIVAADDGPIDVDQLTRLHRRLTLDRNVIGPTAAESGQFG